MGRAQGLMPDRIAPPLRERWANSVVPYLFLHCTCHIFRHELRAGCALQARRYGACRRVRATAIGTPKFWGERMSDGQKLSILYFDDEAACLEVFRETF